MQRLVRHRIERRRALQTEVAGVQFYLAYRVGNRNNIAQIVNAPFLIGGLGRNRRKRTPVIQEVFERDAHRIRIGIAE